MTHFVGVICIILCLFPEIENRVKVENDKCYRQWRNQLFMPRDAQYLSNKLRTFFFFILNATRLLTHNLFAY